VDKISSDDLVAALVVIEGRPWAEYGRSGKAITKHGLAKLLARLKIGPETIKFHSGQGGIIRGYRRDQFEDAFKRFLPQGVPPPLHDHDREPEARVRAQPLLKKTPRRDGRGGTLAEKTVRGRAAPHVMWLAML
jgi:Protein of unknown function (DUF3631)